MWHICHSHRCLGIKGLKSAFPALKILAVNLNNLLVSKCHPLGFSLWIRYASDAKQFSSIAHWRKNICLSSRCAVLIISTWSITRSGKLVVQDTAATSLPGQVPIAFTSYRQCLNEASLPLHLISAKLSLLKLPPK